MKIKQNQLMYGGIILVIAVLTMLIISIQPTQETIISGNGDTQYIRELEKAYDPPGYQITGDTVFIDDPNVYISATPHTGMGWITYNITPKTYTGDIDLVFGFPTEFIKPTKARANPRQVNVTKSYKCEYDFNYTLNPKHAVCFTYTPPLANETVGKTKIYFERDFDSGDIPTKTLYWEEEVTRWTDISGVFNSRNLNFEGLNKWYFKKNIPVVAGEERIFQVFIQPQVLDVGDNKYWMGIKPSGKTIEQAVESNTFYMLDPWTSNYNTDLGAYYKLDESSGEIVDSAPGGQFGGVNTNVTRGVAGLIKDSFQFNGIDSTTAIFNGTTNDNTWTVSFFFNGNATNDNKDLFDGNIEIGTSSGNLIYFSDSVEQIKSSSVAFNGSWNHVLVTADGTDLDIYFNGLNVNNATILALNLDNLNAIGSKDDQTGAFWEGQIDELAIWNRTLNISEAIGVWNNGQGISIVAEPVVNIIFPVNGTTFTESVTQLNYSVDLAQACWFSTNGGGTNSSPVSPGVNFTLSSDPSNNNWTVFCNNSDGDLGSDLTQFFVNKSVGTELISPINTFKTNFSSILFSYNSTTLNTNLTNTTFFIWFSNGTLIQSNFTSLSGTSTVNTQININGLIDETYLWSAETCGENVVCNMPTNRSFEVHNVSPAITINFPNGLERYHLIGDNLTLNWTVTEPGETLGTHITNCSYTYNNVVTNLTVNNCVVTNETSFSYILGINNLTFNVTDEFGLTNSTTTIWDFRLVEINQTFINLTTEGSLGTYLANVRLGSGLSVTSQVTFDFNGTITAGQSFVTGDNVTVRKLNALTPGVDADENLTFHWALTLSDTTQINLSDQNVTVLALGIDNCSTFTTEILNFTVIDEETQVILPNATVEIAVNVLDQTRTITILSESALHQKVNPVRICLNQNISTGVFYSLDTIVRYEDVDKANEYYNIVNATLTNGTPSQRIFLFDLNLSDSIEFQLTFTGSDFLPVENALVSVDRQYISENLFKTVELPKTDFNGQAVLHLVRNDVIYNIRIVKDGVVLGNFENIVAFCDDFTIGDCNIELNAFDSVEDIFNYDSDLGIIFTNPVFNATTNKVSFDFISSDGTTKTVLLEVTRNDIFGNRSICNATLISSGGTLTCDVPPNLDDTILKAEIKVDGFLTSVNQVRIDTTNFGVGGYLVMFVMALSFVFMFSGSKTGVLVSLIVTLAGSIGLGIITGSLIGLGASGMWLLIIVAVGIYKLNKDRVS